MPVYDVRRRILRGFAAGAPSVPASTTTPSNVTVDSAAPDTSIETPTARGRRSASPLPSSIEQASFYGGHGGFGESLFTPDSSALPSTRPLVVGPPVTAHADGTTPPRVRRRLPSRSRIERNVPQSPVTAPVAYHHHHHLHHLHKNATRTLSPSTPKSIPIAAAAVPSNILENRGDIVVRNPLTNEPDMVYLQTDVALTEQIYESECACFLVYNSEDPDMISFFHYFINLQYFLTFVISDSLGLSSKEIPEGRIRQSRTSTHRSK